MSRTIILIGFIALSLLANITLAQISDDNTSQEKLQELCSRYKFLWSDADPSVFYYCFTNKAAVQLKCRAGYYMCKREGEAFHPCDCKFDGSLDEEEDSSRASGEFPSEGCEKGDPFLKYNAKHRFGGVESSADTVGACQLECLQEEDCIGVDWDAKNKQCFVLPKTAERYALSEKEGVSHYMRTFCTASDTVTPKSLQDPDTLQSLGGGGNQFSNDYPSNDYNNQNVNDPRFGKQAISFTTASTPAAAASATCTTATVPDSGCPFAIQKYAGMAHPFGVNITSATENQDENACKTWCISRPYCQGVDWDSSLSTCYYFQEIQPALLVTSTNVNHYRRTVCGRPLQCWSQSGSATIQTNVAVTSIDTPQVQCNGVCFLRQTVSATNPTVERGCLAVATGGSSPALGCSIDTTNLLTATCYCDTDRCNGLSLSAMSSQILYLPLDGDLTDHSGFNRFAVPSNGYNQPTFSCLDRAQNCSALFTGGECIEVRQMTQTVWGPVDASGNVTPQLSLAVTFKRLPDGSTVEEGIFGNSNTATVAPSWAFIGRTNENIIRAGIDSTTAPTGLNDFMRGVAAANAWHSAVLTYDGRDLLALDLPLTRFYIDAVRQSGNEQADMGEVQIRAQPVTVGCVQGLNFTGFIDEVRIFNSVLQTNDIEAINIMRDANFN